MSADPDSSGTDDPATRAPLSYAGPVKEAHQFEDGPLSRFDTAVIAVRMLGLFALLQGMANLAWVVGSLWGWVEAGWDSYVIREAWLSLSPPAVYALASFVLLTRAPKIAAYVVPGYSGGAVGKERPAVQELQGAAFAVAGILICLWAIPAAGIALWWQLQIDSGKAPDGAVTYRTEQWVIFALQMLLGILLFMGSKGLAAFWHRLRHPELAHSQVDERQQ